MSRRGEQEVVDALGWAMAEAESQVRGYPAHRIRPQSEHAWSFDTPNGVAVHVEVTAAAVTAGKAVVVLVASTAGLGSVFRPRQVERTVELSLDGAAARVPAVLYLVFDDGGDVRA